MIGADVRSMPEEFVNVWLNPELIRVSQDPKGMQGSRVRGNATECQVWLRHVVNNGHGNELFVVLFNSGRGTCAADNGGNATMTVRWDEIGLDPECMVSTTELIEGRYLGTVLGEVSVSLRPGASAALRMHPHCKKLPPTNTGGPARAGGDPNKGADVVST